MTERTEIQQQAPKKRGRPAGSTKAETTATQTPAPTAPEVPAAPQIDVQEVMGSATHTYLKALYQEKLRGNDLNLAYLTAQDALNVIPDARLNVQTMELITDLTVREATAENETALAETFEKRQRGLRVTLDHLTGNNPSVKRGPSNPASLGKMTGPKG